MDQSVRNEYLRILTEAFTAYNTEFFSLKLRPSVIRLGSPRSSKDYGAYEDGEIIIRASLLTGKHPNTRMGSDHESGRLLLMRDVLLHQMAHQFCVEILKWPEWHYDGHGPEFRDLCNRIGENLDLPPVRASKTHAKKRHLISCSQWPWGVRPTEYYEGAFTPRVPVRRRSAVAGIADRIAKLDLDEKRELRDVLTSKKLL